MSPSMENGAIETPPRAPSPLHNFGTLAVHAGSPHDEVTGAVIESVGSPWVSAYGVFAHATADISIYHLCPDRRW